MTQPPFDLILNALKKMDKVTRVTAFVAANLKSESSHPGQNMALSKDTVHICGMMAIKV